MLQSKREWAFCIKPPESKSGGLLMGTQRAEKPCFGENTALGILLGIFVAKIDCETSSQIFDCRCVTNSLPISTTIFDHHMGYSMGIWTI